MQNREIYRRMKRVFSWITIIVGIGLVTGSCSQTKMVSLQFRNIEIQYPESWSVENSTEGLLFQPGDDLDAGITILFNPPEYIYANLQRSLEDFLSSEFLPNLKDVLTTSPVQDSNFNGYPAAEGQVVADVARSEGATYALQFDLILVEHEDERALIIVHRRGGLETINEDIAEDIESILRSFHFQGK